jgi:hypothetical protein
MMQCDDVVFAEILVLEYSLLGESTKKHVATSANFGECDHTQTECDHTQAGVLLPNTVVLYSEYRSMIRVYFTLLLVQIVLGFQLHFQTCIIHAVLE